MELDQDPRWRRLHDREWTCPCCGSKHGGLFDLVSGKPDHWRGDREKLSNREVLSSSDILTEDFCAIDGQNFFVRCILLLPIVGCSNSEFGFGVWVSLSKKNFDLYRETFDDGNQGHLGPWFGWFSNELKGYPNSLNLKCQVRPRDNGQRPYIELEPTDHPLAVEQRDGIEFERILEIYALNGHDLRTALAD